MPQTSRFAVLLATILFLFAIIPIPAQAQDPVLVPQSAGNFESSLSGSGGTAEFGASGKWIATNDGSGRVLIFDIESGRIAQQIGTSNNLTELIPHPSKDIIATVGGRPYEFNGPQSIALYDVISGRELWRKNMTGNCSGLNFSKDGATLNAVCSETSGRKQKNTVMHWEVEGGAETRGLALPDGFVSRGPRENGRWIAYTNIGFGFTNPFKKNSKPEDMISQMYGKSTGFIVDAETGQTVGTYPGIIAALSAEAHTAMINTRTGLVLIQIPDNKTLGTFGGPRTMDFTSYTTVRTSLDGTRYILTTASKISFVDAATGAVTDLPSIQASRSAAAAFARDNDQVALAEGPTVTLFRLSKPDERRRLGNASALAAPDLTAELSAEAAQSLVAANRANEEKRKKDLEQEYSKKISKAKPEERQRLTAELNQKLNDNPMGDSLTEHYMKKMVDYTSQFGAQSLFPPVATFIDKGHLLVLLSAGGGWDVWDVATGNRLPYHVDFSMPLNGFKDDNFLSFSQENIKKIEKDLNLPPEDYPRSIPVQERSAQKRLADSEALSMRKGLKDPITRFACSSQGGEVVAQIAWNYKSIQSVPLHRPDGTTVDLMAKGIDVSTFKPSTRFGVVDTDLGGEGKGLCTLSPDAHRIVLEVIRPGHKEKKFSYKVGLFSMGIPGTFSDSLVVYDTGSGQRIAELEREVPDQPFDVGPGELVFSPDGTRLIAGAMKSSPSITKSALAPSRSGTRAPASSSRAPRAIMPKCSASLRITSSSLLHSP